MQKHTPWKKVLKTLLTSYRVCADRPVHEDRLSHKVQEMHELSSTVYMWL